MQEKNQNLAKKYFGWYKMNRYSLIALTAFLLISTLILSKTIIFAEDIYIVNLSKYEENCLEFSSKTAGIDVCEYVEDKSVYKDEDIEPYMKDRAFTLAFIDSGKRSEMTLEEYLTNYAGTTLEAFTAEMTTRCEDSVKQQLIKDAIAAAEGITLSDEEYKEGVANYAKELGFPDVETFESQYNVDVIKESLIAEKIMAMLEENAVEVEGFTYTPKN